MMLMQRSLEGPTMSLTLLFGILTVAMGCYIFLYLAGKEYEVLKKDRHIKRWMEQQEAETRAKEKAEQAMQTITVYGTKD